MTAWLTLAKGEDRWEENGRGGYRYKEEGALWLLLSAGEKLAAQYGEPFVVLKPHVADWCFEHIGPYRIVERAPSSQFGPEHDDRWEIEFKDEGCKVAFQLMWSEQIGGER